MTPDIDPVGTLATTINQRINLLLTAANLALIGAGITTMFGAAYLVCKMILNN